MAKSPTYFFINHSCKEFCYFKNNVPVFGAISSFMSDKIGWILHENIVISTDKKLPAKVIINYYLNEDYKDISNKLVNLKKKRSFMDILLCRSTSVVYPLWDTISNMPSIETTELNTGIAEAAIANLDTMNNGEKLVVSAQAVNNT